MEDFNASLLSNTPLPGQDVLIPSTQGSDANLMWSKLYSASSGGAYTSKLPQLSTAAPESDATTVALDSPSLLTQKATAIGYSGGKSERADSSTDSDPLTGIAGGAALAGSRADLSIKDTNYSIPSGAYFVSIESGDDTNSGTKSSPWRTLHKAVEEAPDGSTIVIRGGTYRGGGLTFAKELTLQPYPHEKVWIKGSKVVTDWVTDGSMWRKDNWSHEFTPISTTKLSIDPAHPEAGHLEMVFVNGQSLSQALNKDKVGPGKFYLDRTNNRLYIGTNPFSKTVEVTASEQALTLSPKSADSVVRGIGFAHYAEQAVEASSSNATLENNTFAHNGIGGAILYGADSTVVRGNTFTYNGRNGFRANDSQDLLVEDNTFSYNNAQHFSNKYDAAGAKFTQNDGLVVRDNVFERNNSRGLWLDVSCTNSTVVRNIVRYNKNDGIFFELSHKAIIASNLVHHNERGIDIRNSTSARVFNNTLAKNGVNIRVSDDERVNTNSTEYAAGITWQTTNVVLKNNILSNISGTITGWEAILLNIYTDIDLKGRKLVSEVNNNGYYRTSSSPGYWENVARYRPVPGDTTTYPTEFKTIAEFSDQTGFEKNALAIGNVATNPFFVDEADGDYRLKSGSPAIGRGKPLPADIASAIGVQSGVKVNLGALRLSG